MFAVEPIYRHRRSQTGSDGRGNPIYKWTRTSLADGLFSPGGTVEPVEPGREPVVTSPTIHWFKMWPDVVASDRIEVRGATYEVIGEPAEWRGTRVGGLVVKLRRVAEGEA